MTRHYRNAYKFTAPIFALLSIGALAPETRADERKPAFNARSIEGTWGFSGEFGMIVPPASAQPVPTAAVGIVVFDGTGGCSVTSTTNINGTILGPLKSISCSYSVNPDGTGASVAEFPGQPPAGVVFVITDRRREIRFINTNAIVGGFTAKRQ